MNSTQKGSPKSPQKGTPESTQDQPPRTADDAPAADDPALQGEGNYTAARRHRKSVQDFVDAGRVEPAAREAEPDSAAEADALKQAEEAGRAHARK